MLAYWRFYWPLTLTGLGMVLAVQVQNGVLARFPNAITELAVFALAYSTYGFFNAALNFTAQLSNVYARSPHATRLTRRFVLGASVVLMVPLLLIAHSDTGARLIGATYGIDRELTARVIEYLILLGPLVLLSAQRFYLNGMLIQAQLTGWVTMLTGVFLVTVVSGLLVGFTAGFKPAYVLVGSEAVALLVQIGLAQWVKAHRYQPPTDPEHRSLTYMELLRFFVPVSTTGVMFALSRPVLFAFVSRSPNGVLAIAALRVAFDLSVVFQQAANQFRHFFVTFGLDDIARKRIFMALVGAGLTALMLLYLLTPLSRWVWQDLMAIPQDARQLAMEVFGVLCLMPAVIIWRNYYHGHLMVARRTNAMAVGGVLRVVSIFVLAYGASSLGWLDHTLAALILILGFVAETLVVAAEVARQKGQALRENATRKM